MQDKEQILNIPNLDDRSLNLPPFPYPPGSAGPYDNRPPPWSFPTNNRTTQQQSSSFLIGFVPLPQHIPPRHTTTTTTTRTTTYPPIGFNDSFTYQVQDPMSSYLQCSQHGFPCRYKQENADRKLLPPPSALMARTEATNARVMVEGYYNNKTTTTIDDSEK